MKKILLILLFLTSLSLFTRAQDSICIQRYPKISGRYILSGFTDTWSTVVSLAHWKSAQWLGFGMVAAGTALLVTQDERISAFARSHHDTFTDGLAKYGLEPLGSGLSSVPLVGGLYLGGRLAHNYRLSSVSLTAVKAAAVTFVISQAGKQLIHRHRPFQDDPADAGSWDGPFSDFDYTSFPSGHSAFAFAIASVYASEYRDTGWVPVLAYSLATATALSRVYQDRHWASDALVGSFLGYATGRFLWKINREVSVVPVLSGSVTGFTAVMKL